jgi:hypothetical protein
LADKCNQLASVLQLLSESPKFIRTLSISAASLSDLANLTPTEANIWICVVGLLAGFELQASVSNGSTVEGGLRLTYLETSEQWPILVVSPG